MSSKPHKNRLRSFTISFVSRFLAVFILSSFALALLPVATSASSMPCCAGKAEGHCDSGLSARKAVPPPDKNDPMCGLKSQPLTSESLDAVTVVADPVDHAKSHESRESTGDAFKTPSVHQQCHMDCGACAISASRHKRQKDAVQAKTTHAPTATTIARFEPYAPISSSTENWTRISPRGPPSRG